MSTAAQRAETLYSILVLSPKGTKHHLKMTGENADQVCAATQKLYDRKWPTGVHNETGEVVRAYKIMRCRAKRVK